MFTQKQTGSNGIILNIFEQRIEKFELICERPLYELIPLDLDPLFLIILSTPTVPLSIISASLRHYLYRYL